MKSVLYESKVENDVKTAAGGGAGCCGDDVREVAKKVEQGLNDVRAALSARLEDGKIAVERLVKRGRYAVEDGLGETAHRIKRHPFSSLAIAFAAGAAVAFLLPRSHKK